MPMVDRKVNGPLMMPVSEKYKDMGTIVVGKIESGRLHRNDTLVLMPNRTTVEVSAIYSEMEDEIEGAICGDNVRIRLKGVDDEDISTGFVLTSPSNPVHAVRRFEAQLAILEHKNIICAGYSAVLHVHTLAEEINLAVCFYLYWFVSSERQLTKSNPMFFSLPRHYCITLIRRPGASQRSHLSSRKGVSLIGSGSTTVYTKESLGQKIVALIETAAPICIERFADYPQMGRFTLRDEGMLDIW